MPDAPIEPVEITRSGDTATARLRRVYPNPPAELWAALTDPDLRAQWLAPGRIELTRGGKVRLDFQGSGMVIDSHVTAIEPGRRLDFAWSAPGEPQRPLSWTIAEASGGGAVTLALTQPAGEDLARSCAGWSAHFEMLAAALAGAPIPFPFERFKAAREAYKAQLGSA